MPLSLFIAVHVLPPFPHPARCSLTGCVGDRYGTVTSAKAIVDRTSRECKGVFGAALSTAAGVIVAVARLLS